MNIFMRMKHKHPVSNNKGEFLKCGKYILLRSTFSFIFERNDIQI